MGVHTFNAFFKKKINRLFDICRRRKHHNTVVTDCSMFIQFKMSRVAPTLRQYLQLCEAGMTALIGIWHLGQE